MKDSICGLLDCMKFRECEIDPKSCHIREYYFAVVQNLEKPFILHIKCSDKIIADNNMNSFGD